MKSAPLTLAEGQYYLGDLLLHRSDLEGAEKYLQQAIALEPSLAIAHAALGMLYVRRERFEDARRHLERAVALDAKNHLVHYYYAYMLSRVAVQAGGYVLRFAPEVARTMRTELGKAIALEPGYAASYHLLAFVNLVTDEQWDESIELLRRAISLAPGEKNYESLLAKFYIRKQDYKSARLLLEPIARDTAEPQLCAQAQSLLKQLAAIEEQMALYGAGRNAESSGGAPPPQSSDGHEAEPAFEQMLSLPRREGEEHARGQLLRIDCEAEGVTMAVRVGDRTLRLHNNELAHIRFITYTTDMKGRISCGPRNPANTVIVIYRPSENESSKIDGTATAIAFIPKEPEAPR